MIKRSNIYKYIFLANLFYRGVFPDHMWNVNQSCPSKLYKSLWREQIILLLNLILTTMERLFLYQKGKWIMSLKSIFLQQYLYVGRQIPVITNIENKGKFFKGIEYLITILSLSFCYIVNIWTSYNLQFLVSSTRTPRSAHSHLHQVKKGSQ